ncbi:heparinase II/III family protein [Kangiella sp. HZ709]|uniref:heparinase II/III domain-containing protein n=1 Tax=Kangiella sp. HZ709 TaxID=2666328 RepID=UPI0012B07AB1|nr:hypothetical protein [Kangiella sp. HZ709]
MNISRVKYLVKRVTESPFDFLLKKINVELNKKVLYRAGSALLKAKLNKAEISLQSKQSSSINPVLSNEQLSYLLTRVNAYKDKGYPCLGYGNVDIQSDETFHYDSIHDYKWNSNANSFDIDFVLSNITCDVKVPWEKSRLQWLVEKALLCTNGEWDINDVYSHLKLWSDQNTFLKGVNWISSMEVAIRLVNLAFVYLLVKANEHHDLNSLLEQLIAKHDVYLELYPEISDIPGNHYLATEVGKIVVSYLKQQSYSEKVFNELLIQQFPNDGVQLEYSTVYHRLCVDLAVIGYLFISFDDMEKEVSERINRLVNSLSLISSKKGLLPIFGDSDSGQVLNFGQSSRSCNLYFDWRSKETAHTIYSAVLEQIGMRAIPKLTEEPSQKPFQELYPFLIMTKDSYKAVIRYGKAGLKERAPHDHDDMLSFWLFKGGDDIVLERGCAPYTSDIRLREEYLSSLSHNVIMNNSGTRADFKSGSVFRTVEMGECSLLEQELSSVSLLYKDRDITHQRRFCLTEAGLTIHDSWKAEKGLLFTLYLSPYAESDILNLDNIKKEQSCLIEDYGNKSGTELNKLMLNLKNEGSLDFVIK